MVIDDLSNDNDNDNSNDNDNNNNSNANMNSINNDNNSYSNIRYNATDEIIRLIEILMKIISNNCNVKNICLETLHRYPGNK